MPRRQFIADVMDLCTEQGWTWRAKNLGFLLMPKVARPGYAHVFIMDPRGDNRKMHETLSRLRKAGLKFPEDDMTANNKLPPTALVVPMPECVPPNRFAQAREKIETALTALSELSELLTALEADTAKVQQLRELLKGF